MSVEELKGFGGVWKRTSVDANYDAFLQAQGQGWMMRKAAAVAPFTKTLSFKEPNNFDDHTSIAGLLNVHVSYVIHPNEEAARAAREAGQVSVEEALGKRSELVAWWDQSSQQMVLHRVFPTEGYQGFYRHSLRDSQTVIQLDLEIRRLDGSSPPVPSRELFQKQ